MYEANCIHVKVEDKLTDKVIQEIGLRQGDNLSPNLFKLYINDLPECFNSTDDQVLLDDMSLSCLMYADDLVLLSTTEGGLKNCLNKLETYCDKYGLTVNLKKTNIMTFSKSGRQSSTKFFFKNNEIVHVSSYKYLGILFSSTGTFSHCVYDLYKRALKANFKLRKSFGDLHQNVDTMLHLFDHTVKPVLLYSSEIWGSIDTTTSSFKKGNFNMCKSLSDKPYEKLHVNFLKYVLGVHKKATNSAVMGELGRYPIYIDVLCNSVKYFERLNSDHVSTLLKNAFKESNNLHSISKKSWASSTYFLLEYLNLPISCLQSSKLEKIVKQKLVEKYKQDWSTTISNCRSNNVGKLRTYALFKNRLCREPYLNVIKDKNIRKCFSNFRISSHKLEIEIGRYKKVDLNLRTCKLCKSGSIEDEKHLSQNAHHLLVKEMNSLKQCPNSQFILT